MIYQIKDNRVYVKRASERDWEMAFDIEYIMDVFLANIETGYAGYPKLCAECSHRHHCEDAKRHLDMIRCSQFKRRKHRVKEQENGKV